MRYLIIFFLLAGCSDSGSSTARAQTRETLRVARGVHVTDVRPTVAEDFAMIGEGPGCVIEGDVVVDGPAGNVLLRDFKIYRGTLVLRDLWEVVVSGVSIVAGGGIVVEGCSGVTIMACNLGAANTRGIYVRSSRQVRIVACDVHENDLGVEIRGSGEVVVTGCTVIDPVLIEHNDGSFVEGDEILWGGNVTR